MSQQSTDWKAFHKRYSRSRPPYRLDPATADIMGELIQDFDAHVLELGVTPELANLGKTLTAVDWSEPMLAHIWPGDSATRRAIKANWWELEPLTPKPTAVVGDGSLACVKWPAPYIAVFTRLAALLSDRSRLVLRCYIRPDQAEPIEQIVSDVMAGKMNGFHAFKLRLSIALAGATGNPNIAIKDILAGFNAAFPDRQKLASATGWSVDDIAEMDAYKGSDAIYSFVTRKELVDIIPDSFTNVQFHDAGTYEMAEHCPLLVMEFRP